MIKVIYLCKMESNSFNELERIDEIVQIFEKEAEMFSSEIESVGQSVVFADETFIVVDSLIDNFEKIELIIKEESTLNDKEKDLRKLYLANTMFLNLDSFLNSRIQDFEEKLNSLREIHKEYKKFFNSRYLIK